MQITNDALRAIFTSFNTTLQAAIDTTPLFWDKIAFKVPSAARQNVYGWMAELPHMREWIGERIVRNLVANAYTLVNKDYELTIGVSRNDILDDQLGVYGPRMQMMGMSAAKLPDDLTASAMINGSTNLAWDGQPFFNTSHPVGDAAGNVYSNYSASGMALTSANYNSVKSTMASYIGASGKAMGITPNLLIVPPQLELAARQILYGQTTAPAAAAGQNAANVQSTNMLIGSANLVVVPELASQPTAWYLADATKPVKAIIWQERQAPQMVPLANPEDPNVFFRKEYIYGVDSRGAVGYSLPFLMYKAVA